MSEISSDRPIDFGAIAAEPPAKSTRAELDAVGEAPDTGHVTPSDQSQHAPDGDDPTNDASAGLLGARLPFGVDPS